MRFSLKEIPFLAPPVLAVLVSSFFSLDVKANSLLITETFQEDRFTEGANWRRDGDGVEMGGGVLVVSGSGSKSGRATVAVPQTANDQFISVSFYLKAPANVGFGSLSVELDDVSGEKYAIMLTASPKFFGDSTGYWDKTVLGKAGQYFRPDVSHFVILRLDPNTDSAVLEVDGEVVLDRSNLRKSTGLSDIKEVSFLVGGAALWRVSDFSLMTGDGAAFDQAALERKRARDSVIDDIAGLKAAIKALERVPDKTTPPMNAANLTWIETTMQDCLTKGYTREVEYWKIRQRLSEEQLAGLRLKLKVKEADAVGSAVSVEDREGVLAFDAVNASRTLSGDAHVAAEAALKRVNGALTSVNVGFSWLRVKTQLLSELINSYHRAVYYKSIESSKAREAQSPSIDVPALMQKGTKFDKEFQEIVSSNREWEVEYGECFFGSKELQLSFAPLAKREALAKRAEELSGRLSSLETLRAQLESEVLNAFDIISPGRKGMGLGVPYRSKDVSIDASGIPTELLFSSLGFGYPGADILLEEPLCVDVIDMKFNGLTMEGKGVVAEIDPKTLLAADRLANVDGYYFKQPLVLNSYFRPSSYRDTNLLPEEDRNDPELLLQDSLGQPLQMANIWHPKIRELLDINLTAVAEYCRQNIPNLLLYEKLTWEGSALGNHTDIYGYNKLAIEAFRQKMQKKFGSIDKLNEAWKSHYADFSAISPPPSPFQEGDYKPNALTYEFHVFRMESWAKFQDDAVRSLQKGDPGRPVGTEFNGITGSFVSGTVPSNRIWKASPVTFVEDHHNNWLPNYAGLNFGYSLCLYAGKQPIETEFIWTYPRLIEPKSEDDFRITGELSVWRKMVWGRKILQYYAPQSGWAYNHGYLDERFSCLHQPEKYFGIGGQGSFVREAATSLVVGKKRAREFWPYLKNTEVLKPKIGIIVPTTSMINEYPFEALTRTYPVYTRAFLRWDRLLAGRDFDFRYIPEDTIVDGDESLEGFKVLILPYMTYFPQGLEDRLLSWTEKGGLLVAEGVAGVMDAYGFETPGFMHKLFGKDVNWTYSGEKGRGTNWRWDLNVRDGSMKSVKITKDGSPVLLEAQVGKGRAIVAGESFNSFVHKDVDVLTADYAFAVPDNASVMPGADADLLSYLYETLSGVVPTPAASSRNRKFELVVREDNEKQRYLFINNAELSGVVTDEVTVEGEYEKICDLGIGENTLVPIETSASGKTVFAMRLAPGEATCLKLYKK